MKSLKLGRRLLLIIQSPIAIGLLVSAYAHRINPEEVHWAGVAGLSYPAFLLGQLVFTIYWLMKSGKVAIGSALVLIIGIWPHWNTVFRISSSSLPEDAKSITVLSANVRAWSPYNETPRAEGRQTLISGINEQNADVICLQEFMKIDGKDPLDFPHRAEFSNGYNRSLGYVVYSKYPVVKSGQVDFSKQRGTYRTFMWCDLQIDSQVVRVVNVHLVNTGLTPEDYQSLGGESSSELDSKKLEIEGKAIYRTLAESYSIRGNQADELEAFIENSPHPVILCGDFNDTPSSYAYHQIAENLKDAFAESGAGTGDTYNKMKLFSLRIDYIFADPTFSIGSFKTLPIDVSDHKPVVCQIQLAN